MRISLLSRSKNVTIVILQWICDQSLLSCDTYSTQTTSRHIPSNLSSTNVKMRLLPVSTVSIVWLCGWHGRNKNVTVMVPTLLTRCPWYSCYRRRKWTRRHEFKSWTRMIAFHIALIPLGKVWIQLFSLQLWVNSRTD